MKIIPLVLTVMIASLFLFGRCEKDKDDDNNYFFKATVNGNPWQAADIIVLNLPTDAREPHRIIGTSEDGSVIDFQLSSPDPQTYNFRQNDASLVYFYVLPQLSQLRFQWQTSEEINTKEFVVESSADGSNWTPFFTEQAAGTAHSYEKIVSTSGTSYPVKMYFRIKMINTDDSFTYSPITNIHLNYVATYGTATGSPWVGNNGKLEITTVDPVKRVISGYFHFRTGGPGVPRDITNGEFRLQY